MKAALEEARTVLNNAKTQAELSQAQAKLVTATTKLKTKPKDEKQPPAGDTTNGKPTVGFKATNTEKSSDSNSIANSGARDKRHGKALDRSNPFRTDADPDPAANRTYTLPGDSASIAELANSLRGLESSISNETKLASIDEVGALKNVQAGEVKEIDEFGGWSAVSADGKKGKFAIARKTNDGVFPIETVNVTRAGYTYTAHVEENSFDRSHEYALFLSKVRTYATKSEETFDGQPFKDVDTNGGSGEGRQIARGLKGFNGIEKTYKAYSSSTGTGVNISFKTGFTGDIDGFKAGYKVEVIAKFEDGHTQSIYNQSFRPDQSINDTNKQVTSVDANDSIRFTVGRPPEPTIDVLNQKLAGYKNRQGNRTGSFTSKNIDLPKGAVEYTVRISASDNSRLGMGYQTTWSQYALPVSGLGFSITQDTNRVARTLLERVYNKLLDTRDADKRGKTPESQKAYQDQLDAIKALLDGTLQPADAYKKILTNTLEAQNALKVDKSALTTSTGKLEQLVDDDPTPGKTPETVSEYNIAKNAAEEEARKAKLIIDDEHATVDQVAQAVADVKAKRAELKAARAELVVAATDAQKTKLQNDSNALTEADKTGKTPKSIAEYEAKYETLKTALTAAKAQAKAVLDKAENAGKVEATDAQIEVDKIKAELDKAAALLKDKGNTAELEKAKNDLSDYITQQTNDNVTAGKTKDSQDAYAIAKTAADKAVEDAAAVIASENSTVEDVANALADIKVKKAELEAAKKNLVPAATDAQKAKLEADAAKLVKADTAGKTQDSINAYETTYTNLTAELEAAKAKATAVKAAGDNASEYAVLKAQEAVDAVQAKLEAAKATLVEKATEEQVAELRKAEAALTPIAENTLDGVKTPNSIEAYKQAVAAIQTDLTQAKAKAAELVEKAKANNATKADATVALAKVEELKAKLAEAKGLLKDKANTTELTNAKEALKALAATENVTAGKTKETADKYDAAKAEADQAVTDAETLIANPNATPEQVAAAVSKVNDKKAALEKAKAGLVTAATPDQKQTLATDAEALKKADTAGKTPESIEAYNAKFDQLSGELEAAKQAAKDVADKGANASEVEALKAQEKVNAVKAKLAEAAATLKDPANKDALTQAKTALEGLTGEEAPTGKTADSLAAYTAAKEAATAEITEAQKVLDNANATPEQVAAAVSKVNDKKAALEKAKAGLVDKITQDQKDDLANAEENLKLADTTGKTKDSIKAYNDEVAKLSDELVAAKKAAKDLVDKGDNAGELEAYRVQAKINKLKSKLADAAKLLKDIDKSAAKKEVEEAAKNATDAIVANNDLTSEQKEAAKAKVAEEATKATAAIDKATTEDDVTTAKESGKLGIEKEAAKAEIEAAKAAKEKAIEANADLTPEQKAAAKAKVAEAATKATAAIDQATTKDGVTTATDAGKLGIEKEAAKAEIEAATAAKEKAIDARTDLTDDEKAKAKAKVAEEAKKAIEAIESAKTHNDVLAKTETGKDDIKKINPIGVKETATKAIEQAASNGGNDGTSGNNAATNTDVKVDRVKLESEILQLDELIIKESAKLDAETAKEANDLLADAKKVFANADASQAEVDAMVKRIEDFMAKVAPATDHATPANDQAAQTPAVAPATTQAAANASQESATNARKAAKELPNTGTADSTVAMVAAAASALLGLGLAGRRRKEDEEA